MTLHRSGWLSVFLLCSIAASVSAVSKVATCSPSVTNFIDTLPELSIWRCSPCNPTDPHAYRTLAKDCPGDVPAGYTMFVATTAGVNATISRVSSVASRLGWFNALNGDVTITMTMPNGTRCKQVDVRSAAANGIALFNQIPQGAYTSDQLLAMGMVPTALSFVTYTNAYSLSFYLSGGGQVCINATTGGMGACILSSYFGCDGIMHVTDGLLMSSTDPATTPTSLQTMYDILPLALLNIPGAAQPSDCSATLAQALAADQGLTWAAGAVSNGLPSQQLSVISQDLIAAFNSSATSISYFATTDAGYLQFFNSSAGPRDLWSWPLLTPSFLHQALPRPYCARELLQQGRVNTIFGSLANSSDALTFRLGEDGKVVVSSSDGTTATIVRAEFICSSIIYVVDGVLGLPKASAAQLQLADVPAEQVDSMFLTPRPLKHPLVCYNSSGVEYAAAAASSVQPAPSPLGSLRVPLPSPAASPGSGKLGGGAIAAVIGGSVTVCVAILAMVVIWWRRVALKRAGHIKIVTTTLEFDKAAKVGIAAGSSPGASEGLEKGILKMSGTSRPSALASSWDICPEMVKFDEDAAGELIVLGRGGFGVVFRGVLNGVQPVAIKVLRHPGPESRQAFLREVDIMHVVSRDRNVVQFYGTISVDADLMIVSELMEGGDLGAALADPERRAEMAWGQAGSAIALDVARGLCFLHANNVIHRDIKSKNILLTADKRSAKIADVGTAAIHNEGYLTSGAGHTMGTFAWAAPELLLNNKVSPASDIYSFGILLWELVMQRVPQRGSLAEPVPGKDCPAELVALMNDCRKQDPKQRPTAKQVYDRLAACPNKQTNE